LSEGAENQKGGQKAKAAEIEKARPVFRRRPSSCRYANRLAELPVSLYLP
jgi:hypothetical protein